MDAGGTKKSRCALGFVWRIRENTNFRKGEWSIGNSELKGVGIIVGALLLFVYVSIAKPQNLVYITELVQYF